MRNLLIYDGTELGATPEMGSQPNSRGDWVEWRGVIYIVMDSWFRVEGPDDEPLRCLSVVPRSEYLEADYLQRYRESHEG
jgi:hypothetical protein